MAAFNTAIKDRIRSLKPRVSSPAVPVIPNSHSFLSQYMQDSAIAKPGFCCLGVVDTCMLRCKMCDKWKTDIFVQERRAPSVAEWKTFLTQLRDITEGPFEIDFGGGEAFMLPGLLDIVRHAADLGFTTVIASNGWSINEKMAKKIADSGLSKLIVSLDSLKPEIHDEIRGVKGVHARVMKAIENLDKYRRDKDFIIGICSIMMDKTMDGILDLYKWASNDERIRHILFMAVMQPNNTDERFRNGWHQREQFEGLWPKEPQKAVDVIDQLIAYREKSFDVANSIPQLQAHKKYFQNPMDFVKTSPCNMDKAVHVSAVGDIFLCFKWDTVGNIMTPDTDIRKIWYSKEAEAVRNNIRTCKDNCHFLLNCYFEKDYPFELKKKAALSLPDAAAV